MAATAPAQPHQLLEHPNFTVPPNAALSAYSFRFLRTFRENPISRPEMDCGNAVASLLEYCTIQHRIYFKGNKVSGEDQKQEDM